MPGELDGLQAIAKLHQLKKEVLPETQWVAPVLLRAG
jgi:hypothetical protein